LLPENEPHFRAATILKQLQEGPSMAETKRKKIAKSKLARKPPEIETFRRLVTTNTVEQEPVYKQNGNSELVITTGKVRTMRIDTFTGVRVPGHAERTMNTIAVEVVVTSSDHDFLRTVRRAESHMMPVDPEGSTSMSFDVRTYFDAEGELIPKSEVPADAQMHWNNDLHIFAQAEVELAKVAKAETEAAQT